MKRRQASERAVKSAGSHALLVVDDGIGGAALRRVKRHANAIITSILAPVQ